MHAMGSADGEIPFSLALVKNEERRSSGYTSMRQLCQQAGT